MTDAESRIEAAADLAFAYGGIAGAHHKQWLIDQMLRAMLGPDVYEAWRSQFDSATGEDGDTYDPWDEGIAP